jgi:hypothetical protein
MAWGEKIINGRQVVYWTKQRKGCALEPGRIEPLVWTGPGLVSVGKAAGTVAPQVQAQRLMKCLHPDTGVKLRAQHVVVHEDAKLPGDLFAAAVKEKAEILGVDREQVLTFATARRRWGRLERALEGPKGVRKAKPKDERMVPIADLEQMARAAGLDLADVYDPKPLAFARANRRKRTPDGILALGIGLNFPKSVSLLVALASPELAAALEEELLAVVHECMELLNFYGGYALSGHQGDGKTAARTRSAGLMGLAILHGQARPTKDHPGDPHAHAHLSVVNAVLRSDGQWRGAASGVMDVYRFVPLLGEYAKARFRQRTRARFGLRWERDPVTAEWEVAGFGPGVRARYSKRSAEVMAATAGMSAAQRRKVAARLARKERTGDPERLREVLSADEELEAGLEGMLAAALSADPRQRPVPLSLAEVVRGMRMPRHAVLQDEGVQRRQVTTALIGAMGDTLMSLEQAEALTDAVLETAGFVLLSSPKPGSHHTATERYRTPALLVASSRTPVGSRQAVAPEPQPAAPKKAKKPVVLPGQEQLFDLVPEEQQQSAPVPMPLGRHPRPKSAPRRHVELDLGTAGPGYDTDPAGAEPAADTSDPVRPLAHRPQGPTSDQDLAAQLEAAQQLLAAAEQDLADLADAAAALIAAAQSGDGAQARALRLRRARLEEAADALAQHQHLQLRLAADRDRRGLAHDDDVDQQVADARTRARTLLERAAYLADLEGSTVDDLPADLRRAGAAAQWELAVSGDVAGQRRDLETTRIQILARVHDARAQVDQIRAEQQLRDSLSPDEQRIADWVRAMEADRLQRAADSAAAVTPGPDPDAAPAAGTVAQRAVKQQNAQPSARSAATGRKQ